MIVMCFGHPCEPFSLNFSHSDGLKQGLFYRKDDIFRAYSFGSYDINISSGKDRIWGDSWWITCWLLPFVENSHCLPGEPTQRTNTRVYVFHSMKLLLSNHSRHAFAPWIDIYWESTTWMKGRPHIQIAICQAGEPDVEVTASQLACSWFCQVLKSQSQKWPTEYQAANVQDRQILTPCLNLWCRKTRILQILALSIPDSCKSLICSCKSLPLPLDWHFMVPSPLPIFYIFACLRKKDYDIDGLVLLFFNRRKDVNNILYVNPTPWWWQHFDDTG